MKNLPIVALIAMSACDVPKGPAGSVVIANEEFGFTVAVPSEVLNTPSSAITGGQAFAANDLGVRMAVWGAPFPSQGVTQLAAQDRGRVAAPGMFITFQQTDANGFEFWAASPRTQVIVQSTEVGVDCDDTPIIASYIYGFDKDRTPGELRYLTSDANFPRFNFAANCS